ncbi:heavy metal translocating P-type ATPase [Pseudanabaena sp. UWO310]|uniref:heavy metal translocating P-type ATPase n=1 Tax=Pseudanabaena sp. UWO310 TaxID=2480795 RepID=UPI00115B1802|nr:heavy metal translocating P-type ATPase [Pseudanabaena sp. UWO310]TYQ30852.1 cadmium-translocating P-type ATPase [Pseudanabaena sp. UWO310]
MGKNCCGDEPIKSAKSHHHAHDEGAQHPQSSQNHGHNHSHDHDGHDGHDHSHGSEEFDLQKEAIPVLVVIVLFLIGSIYNEQLHNTPYAVAEYLILIPAYLLSGWNVLMTAGRNILKGRIFDENFLMTIATLGAIAIHQLPEAVGVMLFFKVGELFQDYAVGNSRRSIKAVLEVRPDYANLKVDGVITKTSPDLVQISDIITVTAGEKIPLDGLVIAGTSQIDTSALTGESIPRSVRVGDIALAGTINKTGILEIQVTQLFGESSIAKILDLVENASSKKAETEKLITKFAKIYTPIVVFISLAIAIVPPLLIPKANLAEWVYRALVILVISCPCGLVISIPLGYFGGIGGAAKRGILIKGSTFLDVLNDVKTVVCDKTGTLTKGTFKVTQIVPEQGFSQDELLSIAGHIEAQSTHPIAQSIKEAYKGELDLTKVSHYEEIAGHGIRAMLGDRLTIAGNDRLLHRESIAHDTCKVSGSVVHLAVDTKYAGYIIAADEIKDDAIEAIQNLHKIGIKQVIMLSGDNNGVAADIAGRLGLDSYIAELLPEGKVDAFEKIISKLGKSEKAIYVGDGINDAPVIARADVGIAMGGLGSDAAIETADVVIMNDSPTKIAEAIQIARKTHSIVWQNIIFALSVKAIFLVLGAFGLATMWEAVFADVGVALAAIANATRVLK